MADIISFKGALYNPAKIKDLSKVVAPPYDVISPEKQDSLYNAEPHNIVRISLGKDIAGDNEKENKYIRAARFLKAWQDKGVLTRDDRNSIYAYLQEFSVDGRVKRRLGFIALLKLEEFDTQTTSVYPHEHTLSAPKEDRTKLISSINANLGPIFAIFADKDKAIDAILEQETNLQPIIDIMDFQGIRNKLWRISEEGTIDSIIRLIRDEKIFIADGHHRYEVGLAFSKVRRDAKYGYILTYFTDIYADGIVILPVHRLVAGVKGDIFAGLAEDLKKDFVVKGVSSKENARSFLSQAIPQGKRFVIYRGNKFLGLISNDKNSLDVNILHSSVIGPLQRKVESDNGKISIDFTKDMDYAINEVDKGRFSFSVLMNPTKVAEVRDAACSGRRMPQKSTYFYPKVLTGLVINVF